MKRGLAVGMVLLGLLSLLYVVNAWYIDGAALRAAYEGGRISGAAVEAALGDLMMRVYCFGGFGVVLLFLGVLGFFKRRA